MGGHCVCIYLLYRHYIAQRLPLFSGKKKLVRRSRAVID